MVDERRFGERGARLYEALCSPAPAPEPVRVLAEESARLADRLDELDRIIAGKGVLDLMRFRLRERWDEDDDRTVTIEVKFDNVLGEARQQAATLRALLATLGVEKVAGQPSTSSEGTALDELRSRRAKRATSG